MSAKKLNKKYYFSVEGETEFWYLKWLENLINSTIESNCTVSFDCKVQKNPLKRAKVLNTIGKTVIYHFSDYESDEAEHVKQFYETMDNMKSAMSIGKQIKYEFGYSNLTFDLWMSLHKCDCNNHLSNRTQYLQYINRGYSENFNSMKQYKQEKNFKRCLSKLQLSDVKDAIKRAEIIMDNNERINGYVLEEYNGFKFYKENPSLLIWESVKKILCDCGLLKKRNKNH